jgi:hypothetical protein
LLAESWQLYQIVVRYGFDGLPGFAPGGKTPGDDERVEPFFPQQQRHPGAGPFARSSTVQINVLIFGIGFEFLFQVVGLQPDRTLDALRIGVVIAVAADVEDQGFEFVIGG